MFKIKNKNTRTTSSLPLSKYPGNIDLFKVNNENTRKRCEMCSK